MKERADGHWKQEDVCTVLARFTSPAGTTSEVVKAAYTVFFKRHSADGEAVRRLLAGAEAVTRLMDFEEWDLAAYLLVGDRCRCCLEREQLQEAFGTEAGSRFYKMLSAYCEGIPREHRAQGEEYVRYRVMRDVCKRMYHKLTVALNAKKVPNTEWLEKAYALAEEAHGTHLRFSGELWLAHSVRVARILADECLDGRLYIDGTVIAAALLHDVPEKTSLGIDRIRNECCVRVAEYVSAVTSVKRDYTDLQRTEGENPTEKGMAHLIDVISADRNMICALFIKAADRIDYLRTLDAMPVLRRKETEIQTETEYLPLFRRLGFYDFVGAIEDLLWRGTQPALYNSFQSAYRELLDGYLFCVDELEHLLQATVFEGFSVRILRREYRPYEVYSNVKQASGLLQPKPHAVEPGATPLCDLHLLLDPDGGEGAVQNFLPVFLRQFERYIADTGRTVISLSHCPEARRYEVELCDRYRNRIRCLLWNDRDFWSRQMGRGGDPLGSTVEESELRGETIRICLARTGKQMTLPKGATALDAAFAIDGDFGLSARIIRVNGEICPFDTVLRDGDRYHVDAEVKRENGTRHSMVSHARFAWFDFLTTKHARQVLIRHFSNRYEESDRGASRSRPLKKEEKTAEKEEKQCFG